MNKNNKLVVFRTEKQNEKVENDVYRIQKPIRNTQQKEGKSLSESFCILIIHDRIKFESWILSFLRTYERVILRCYSLISKSYVTRLMFY